MPLHSPERSQAARRLRSFYKILPARWTSTGHLHILSIQLIMEHGKGNFICFHEGSAHICCRTAGNNILSHFSRSFGYLILQTCLIIVNLFVSYKSKNKISARYYWESVCCCFFFLRFSRRFFTRFLPRLIAFMIRNVAKTAAAAIARISQIGTLLSCTL